MLKLPGWMLPIGNFGTFYGWVCSITANLCGCTGTGALSFGYPLDFSPIPHDPEWQQAGRLDEWRTHTLNPIQTELCAKLLMLLVPHWLWVETGWQFVNRSLVKALHRLCRYIPALISALSAPHTLPALLTRIAAGMTLCRVRKRRKRPAFFPSLGFSRLLPKGNAYGHTHRDAPQFHYRRITGSFSRR